MGPIGPMMTKTWVRITRETLSEGSPEDDRAMRLAYEKFLSGRPNRSSPPPSFEQWVEWNEEFISAFSDRFGVPGEEQKDTFQRVDRALRSGGKH